MNSQFLEQETRIFLIPWTGVPAPTSAATFPNSGMHKNELKAKRNSTDGYSDHKHLLNVWNIMGREGRGELLHGKCGSGTADKIRLECLKQFSGRKMNWSTGKIKLFQVRLVLIYSLEGLGKVEWNCSEVVPSLCPRMGTRDGGGQQGDSMAFMGDSMCPYLLP